MTDERPRVGRADVTGPLVGCWVSLPHPAVAELVARSGAEFVCIDAEHTSASLETVTAMCRAVDAVPEEVETVVRAGGHDPTELKRLLDAGPDAVLVPMVDDAAEARAVVDATRYPPEGSRGVGLSRATAYGRTLAETVAADGPVARLVQVETPAAVENARSIAGVEGVDGVFVGPVDLSAAMGRLGAWDDDQFQRAIDEVVTAAQDQGVGVGTLATTAAERETRLTEWGVDFLAAAVDTASLRESVDSAVEHCTDLRAE